jgi:hypothetical protein
MPIVTRTVPSLIALALVAPLSAQTSDPVAAAERPMRFSFAAGAIHQFSADIEDDTNATDGELEVTRTFARAGVGFDLNPDMDLGLSLGWEGGFYHWDKGNPLSLGTGRRPWNSVQGVEIGTSLGWRLSDEWGIRAGVNVGFAGENDVDIDDAFTVGGLLGATYRFNDGFMLGGGVLVSSRIEDDALVIPLIFVDWRISETLRLTNLAAPAAFPTGAGLELVCEPTTGWQFAIGGQYESRRFRLDGDGPAVDGVGDDATFALFGRVGFKPTSNLRFDAVVGGMAWQRLRLDDRDGNRLAEADVDPSLFVGLFASLSF